MLCHASDVGTDDQSHPLLEKTLEIQEKIIENLNLWYELFVNP